MGHKYVRPTYYHYDHKMSNRKKSKPVNYPEEPNRSSTVVWVMLGLFFIILVFVLYEKFA